MGDEKRLTKLLEQVIQNMENALKFREKGDKKAFLKEIWKVGADLEYLTFLINLKMENSDQSWKGNVSSSRTVDIEGEISSVQSLLREALYNVNTKIEEVYRKTWLAKGHLLSVQRGLGRAK